MKTIYRIATIVAALSATTAAQATMLEFNGLSGTYSSTSLGANMTGNGQYLAYTEAGYTVTLYTTNSPQSTSGAHIGDGSSGGGFDWHDSDHNPGAFVTLTKVGGGAFNLLSFDYLNSNSGLAVTDSNGGAFFLPGDNYQQGVPAGLYGVTFVTFTSTGFTFNELDNILLSTVPEPATWAMMLVGFGLVGATARRRQKVAIDFG